MGIITNKGLAIGIACIMIITVFSVSNPIAMNAAASPATLHVGGTGSGNYTSIQAAINAASNGDTIFIHSGTYTENIVVNKIVTLKGANKQNTVIDGGSIGNVVTITSDWVNLTDFTITKGSGRGVVVQSASDHCRIENNIIIDNVNRGIQVGSNCDFNLFANNFIDNQTWGINLANNNDNNTIQDNIINNSQLGIYFYSNNNDNIIRRNTITNSSWYGIYLWTSNVNNTLYHNKLLNNANQAWDDDTSTNWDSGYPGGGNFFDDYSGSDIFSGAGQNMSGNDGIGDSSYSLDGPASNSDNYPLWPSWDYISLYQPAPGSGEVCEYALGSVKVAVIFVESNGSTDQNKENWTTTRMNTVLNKIQWSLNWWSAQNASAQLTFSKINLGQKATSYEPIYRPHTDENLWINEIMNGLGYSSGTYLQKVQSYNQWLRTNYNTDWAFTMFVVDSVNDNDAYPGCFSDATFQSQWCAWGFWEYGSITMTYDNSRNVWGINNMHRVAAHEIGHMFYATDEYNNRNEWNGYLNEKDNETSGCLMYNNSLCLSNETELQVGWRDSDSDGIMDILDTQPNTHLIPPHPQRTTDRTPQYNGVAVVSPYPNNNPSGSGRSVTLNTITNVEYRLNNGTWQNAQPTDGNFDGPVEHFHFTLSAQPYGSLYVEARANNSVGNLDSTWAADSMTIIQRTIWVDDDFTDNAAQHKWDTIAEGIADAQGGDRVYVYNGIYYESVFVNKSISLQGESNTGTIIDATNCPYVWDFGIWIGSHVASVSNLRIRNAAAWGIMVNRTSPATTIYVNIQITDCVINNSGNGIKTEGSWAVTIKNCTFFSNTHSAILFSRTHMSNILNCNMHNNSGAGIAFFNSTRNLINNTNIQRCHSGIVLSQNSSNNTITNCQLHRNTYIGIQCDINASDNLFSYCNTSLNTYGAWFFKTTNNTISNCSVYYNFQYGINSTQSTPNIIDNVVQGSWMGIKLKSSPSATVYSNTIMNCTTGMNVDPSTADVKNNIFIYCTYGLVIDQSYAAVLNNIISSNTYGIYCYYSDPLIKDNTLSNNVYGIYLENSLPTMSGNTFSNNVIDQYEPGDEDPKNDINMLIYNIESMGLHHGIENSLVSKLESAVASLEKGQEKAAKNKLKAFIKEVKAQKGKKLHMPAALILIDTASGIIESI